MQDIAGKLPITNILGKSQIATVASEPPDDAKWPRSWRLLFIMGVSLALWTAIILAIRVL